ncbi:MAG TPA: PKD domain-containing protein [Ferruginibacter sp.]|nr:PKD domain-containing protein [Ferruginibacter sp.]HRP49321.1 PKD domain-containing protein [Ferruginibacter sp.]
MKNHLLKSLVFFQLLFTTSVAWAQEIVQVGVGEYFTSYRTSNGKLYGFKWGSSAPVIHEFPLNNVIDVDGAQYTNVALTADGKVYVVGLSGSVNAYANLVPTDNQGNPFTGNSKVYGFYQCYLTLRDGNVWYWGIGDILNKNGGNNITFPIQLQQPPGKTMVKLEMGSPTMFGTLTNLWGLASDGTVWQWNRSSNNPVQVTFPGNVAQDICIVGPHAFVVKTADNLYAWGLNPNYAGGAPSWQVSGVQSIKSTWEGAGAVFPIKEMKGNYNTFHIIDANNNMFASGSNAMGEVGNGKEFSPWRTAANPWNWDWSNNFMMVPPTRIPGKFKNLQAGNTIAFYFFVQDMGNNWYSWGRNKALCLGNGTTLSINDYAIYPNAYTVPAPALVTPLTQQWNVINNFNPNAVPPAFANAGVNQYISETSTTLYGQGSFQQDGSITAYAWTKINGPAATIVSPNAMNTQVTGLTPGTYVFRLTITNNLGLTKSSDVTVVVSSASGQNVPPVANAGVDQTITAPQQTVTLTGTGTDSDGIISTYAWRKITGGTVSIVNANAASTVVNGLTTGTYTFEFTVTDNSGASAKDTMQVTVQSAAVVPTANAGPDQTIITPASSVTLSGSGSDAGGITAYSWRKVSGGAATIASPNAASTQVTGLAQGTYRFELTVTNTGGYVDTDTMQVDVIAPSAPRARYDTTINGWNAVVHLPNDYHLNLRKYPTIIFFPGLGEVGTNINALKSNGPTAYLINGGWNGNVYVDGDTVKFIVISLQPPSSFPSASATDSRIQILKSLYRIDPYRMHLTGLSHGAWMASMYVSADPVGSTNLYYAPQVATVVNVQGVQPYSTYEPMAHFARSGKYLAFEQTQDFRDLVNMTNYMNSVRAGSAIYKSTNYGGGGHCCWDKFYGKSAAPERNVIEGINQNIYEWMARQTLSGAPTNQAPTANAGANITITLPVNTATLNGSGTDADGTIASYSWRKITGGVATIANPNAASTAVNGLVQGTYTFELTVTDNSGSTARDTVQVTVNPGANQAPSANAGANITITLPVNTATLNGSGTDADGTIASYSWRKITGGAATIANPNAASTAVNGMVQGTYTFELTVTDNNGATARDTVQVTVNPAPNQAPSANAGANITITLPVNTATLNGSGTDADGTIASYSWRKITGGAATIANPNAASTAVNGMVQGTYTFELTVTDNNGATARDTVQVTVNPAPNQAPSANAGADITITLPVNSATLNGSGTDPDGTIASYSWRKITGGAATIANPNAASTAVNGMVQGTYTFELTVTDNNGATARDTVQVTVNPAPNQAPSANAGADITITLPVNSATLNGSGTDPDGTIASYSWRKTLGGTASIVNANAASTEVNNLTEGVYRFELTVTDNSGATATDIVQVTVLPAPNQAPSANAGADITITLPVNSATLNGSGTDPDGTIASYSWRKTLGGTATIVNTNSASTVVNNLTEGVYRFELTVTDNSGATATDIVQVTVLPAPNQAPSANAGADITITLPVNSATLNGSGTDPDGTIASYSWRKTLGGTATIVNTNSASTVVNNLTEGVYRFELTVTDNSGATATDIVQVTVLPAPNQPPSANAGADITITLPVNSATLNGSGSDPDGTIASYSWRKTLGGTASIVNANAASTAVNNLTEGVYRFELTVTDNSGATATDIVQVTVLPAPNQAPSANAGADITITLPVNSATLNGSGSDPDGTIASYSWRKTLGGTASIVNANAASTAVNNLTEGVYRFELTVTDNSGATATDIVQVTVLPAPNQAPSADAGADQVITLPTNFVTLNGIGNDNDGTVVSYKWTKINGGVATIVNSVSSVTPVNNMVEGVYRFELAVTDNSGAVTRDTMQVTVLPQPANTAPTANAGNDIVVVLPNNSTALNGSGIDPDGTISAYRWIKITGPAGGQITNPDAAQTSVTDLLEGIYFYQLVVTDNSGATGRDTVRITVENGVANIPPVADAGADATIYLPDNAISLAGTGTDVDGHIIRYQWSVVAGPVIPTLTNQYTPTVQVSNLQQGVYQLELIVWDNLEAFHKDTMTLNVGSTRGGTTQGDVLDELTIFPNPVGERLTVNIRTSEVNRRVKITVFDIQGNRRAQKYLLLTQNVNVNQLDVSTLTPGSYIVQMVSQDKPPVVVRMIKQ